MTQLIDKEILKSHAYVLAVLYMQSTLHAPDRFEFTDEDLERLRIDKKIVISITVEDIIDEDVKGNHPVIFDSNGRPYEYCPMCGEHIVIVFDKIRE